MRKVNYFILFIAIAGTLALNSCRRDILQYPPTLVVQQAYTYNDIIPDQLVSSSRVWTSQRVPYDSSATYTLDIDQDGHDDFLFLTTHYHVWYAPSYRDARHTAIQILDSSYSFLQTGDTMWYLALLVDSGEVFGSQTVNALNGPNWGVWATHDFCYFDIEFAAPGSPPSQDVIGDNYIGISRKVGTDYYYGWIKFSKPNDLTLKFDEYAMGTIPNVAVTAGDH